MLHFNKRKQCCHTHIVGQRYGQGLQDPILTDVNVRWQAEETLSLTGI